MRWIAKLAILTVLAFPSLAQTPLPYAAYISPSAGIWNPWTSAQVFGALGYTPQPIALYCQATAGAAWTPCNPSGGGGGATLPFPGIVYATSASGGNVATSSQIQTAIGANVYAPYSATAPVTAVSVATANGLQGTSSGGATPALTLNVDSTHFLPVNTGASTNFLGQDGAYHVPAGTYTCPSATSSVVGCALLGASGGANIFLGYTPANCTAGTTGSDCLVLTSGLVPTANLGSGSASGTTFLTGAQTYAVPFALTTTGSSGAATFTAGTLNIPQYSGGGGSGTVTSVSVTTANGVSGSVATATTTPAISLTLGAITPSSVASTGAVSGTTGTFTGAVSIVNDGVHAGPVGLYCNSTAPATSSNSVQITGAINSTCTPWNLNLPAVGPSATSFLELPSLSSNNTQATLVGVTGTGSVVLATSPSIASPTLTGTVTGPYTTAGPVITTSGGVTSSITYPTYNGTTLTAGSTTKGPGNLLYTVALTGQTASISETSIFTTGETGYWYVCGQSQITTAASSSSSLPYVDIDATSPVDSVVKYSTLIGSSTGNGTYVGNTGCGLIHAKTGTEFGYEADGYASSGGTAMQYALFLQVFSANADGN